MHVFGHTFVILPLIVSTTWSIGTSIGHADEPQINTVKVDSVASVGYYHVIQKDRFIPVTARDEIVLRPTLPELFTPLGDKEIKESISFPTNSALVLIMHGSPDVTLRQKLKLVADVPVHNIHWLVTTGSVDNDSLKLVSRLTALRYLTLRASPALEQNADRLASLSELQYLSVTADDDNKFNSRKICDTVKSLAKLRFLLIAAENITDNDVAQLAHHSSLESVILHTRKPVLSGKSLRTLQKLPKLRQLVIVCTDDITDADVLGFANISALESLTISSDAELNVIAQFKKKLPECDFRIVPPSDE